MIDILAIMIMVTGTVIMVTLPFSGEPLWLILLIELVVAGSILLVINLYREYI